MSLLGKVLVVLNLLGVAGVAVLGAMDYGKRQAWSYAVFREELLLRGLPLDKDERDAEHKLLILDKFHEETKKELFPQGNPVLTQLEEVNRVKNEVQGQIQQAGDNNKQMLACAEVLLPFAVTAADRDRLLAIRTHLATDKGRDEYKKQLEQAFHDGVAAADPKSPRKEKLDLREGFEESLYLQRGELSGPFVDALFAVKDFGPKSNFDQAFGTAVENMGAVLRKEVEELFAPALNDKLSAEQRKQQIAHLLFGLADRRGAGPLADGKAPPAGDLMENPDFKRCVTVSGVRAAIAAAHDQALTVARMVPQAEIERSTDRSVFALQHGRYVERLKERAQEIDTETAQLRARTELTNAHEVELKKRRRDFKETDDELVAAQKETAKYMGILRDLASKLDIERIRFRDARRDNQSLEKKIRELEANHPGR
jgi:hypothetical protein